MITRVRGRLNTSEREREENRTRGRGDGRKQVRRQDNIRKSEY